MKIEPPQRCACPECLDLDVRWPNDGWQMKLFPEKAKRKRQKSALQQS